MKYVFYLLLFAQISQAQQSRFHEGETIYVWALSGLNMRKLPDAKSEKIAALSYGTKVVVQPNIGMVVAHEVEEFKDFKIKGVWLLVKYGDIEGFVFDGYMSRLVAPSNSKEGVPSLLKYMENEIGRVGKTEFRTYQGEKKLLNKKEDNFGLFFNEGEYLTKFNNQITYFRHIGETTNEVITFPNITFFEGYIFVQTIFSNYNYSFDKKHRKFEINNNELCYYDIMIEGKNLVIRGGCNC